jgi:hypothetical protein
MLGKPFRTRTPKAGGAHRDDILKAVCERPQVCLACRALGRALHDLAPPGGKRRLRGLLKVRTSGPGAALDLSQDELRSRMDMTVLGWVGLS